MGFQLSYPPMNSIKTFDFGYSKSIRLSAFLDNMSTCPRLVPELNKINDFSCIF